MNEERRNVLDKNVGKGVVIHYHHIFDSDRGGYDMGIIEEVTGTLVKIKIKSWGEKKGFFNRSGSCKDTSTTYIDISSIRSINFSDPDYFDENGEYRN